MSILIERGCKSHKYASHARWKACFFFLLLMQHGSAILLFLTPLCGKNAKNKVSVLLQRGRKSRKCASHAPWEAHFFMLPMQHGKHIFAFDLTPTVKMTFLKGRGASASLGPRWVTSTAFGEAILIIYSNMMRATFFLRGGATLFTTSINKQRCTSVYIHLY